MARHTFKLQIDFDANQVFAFCERWQIEELAFFGSVLREDFHENSDVDVLVKILPAATWGLFEHVQMQDELNDILGRKVDLVSRRAIEKSSNWLRKSEILSQAKVFYEA